MKIGMIGLGCMGASMVMRLLGGCDAAATRLLRACYAAARRALAADPRPERFAGRWTIHAAIDRVVPAAVLGDALYARFSPRGDSDFADSVQSAMRQEFGGHQEKPR